MPFTNFHAARLQDPSRFDADSWRTTKGGILYGKKLPGTINIIWGKLKGKARPTDPPIAQSLRFQMKDYTSASAKTLLKKSGIRYVSFEPGKMGLAGKVQEARILLMYPKSIQHMTQMEAFNSLRDALNKAVTYKWGPGAFVSDFSSKEVIVGWNSNSSVDRPLSSWDTGEYDKSPYKIDAKGVVTFPGYIIKVQKVTRFENLDPKSWDELWQIDEQLSSSEEEKKKKKKKELDREARAREIYKRFVKQHEKE